MTKKIYLLSAFISFCIFANAQLLITEISYNPPESGSDSLEYIEIVNSGSELDVTGYSMTGVDYTFDGLLAEGEVLVIAVNPIAMNNVFGITAEPFGGALSNGGETLTILDNNSTEVLSIPFDDGSPWPTSGDGTDGEGASIVLCDTDNPQLGESWKVSGESTGIIINGSTVFGSPGLVEDSGCDSGPSGIIVTTDGLTFVPADITINQGETITFTNGGGTHNANGSKDAYPDNPVGFTSGPPSSDSWVYEHTFNLPGFYEYRCDLHIGAGMEGSVTVIPAQDNSDLRITEVFYNSSIIPDSLEFIELFNAGTSAANLENYKLTSSSIDAILPTGQVLPGTYMVLCKNESAFTQTFGAVSNLLEWGEGDLSNDGDNITILNEIGTEIISVSYDDNMPWPEDADGAGSSISLCDPLAPFISEEVKATSYPAISFDGNTFYATPGLPNYCANTIAEISQNDAEGVNTNNGMNTISSGQVYGINYRPNGLQFTIIDENGDGIGVFSGAENYGYTVTEGDLVTVLGNVGQFSGLAQIYTDTLILNGNEAIQSPTMVPNLNEATESQLVRIENVSLIDADQWTNNPFGFNVTLTNGTTEFDVRIDNDVTDIIGQNYPTGTFTITGIGGQFDQNAPFDEGYQLLPRYIEDIDPFVPFVNSYPPRTIGDVKNNDSEGVALAEGDQCTLEGTVYGINLRPSGLQFTIIDENGDGIAVFAGGENFDYTVNEGDEIQIKGTIDQFNGLTEIIPDSIFFLQTGSIQSPTLISSELTENEESAYIEIAEILTLVDPSAWSGDGTTFSVVGTDGSIEYEILIDNDTELSTLIFPGLPLTIRGIGSQRDLEAPFDGGYRIVPNFETDVQFVLNTLVFEDIEVSIYPNPASSYITVETEEQLKSVEIWNNMGQKVLTITSSKIYIDALERGIYQLKVTTDRGQSIKSFIKLGN